MLFDTEVSQLQTRCSPRLPDVPGPRRFFIQQLNLSVPALSEGRKTWDYYDSFDDASTALDIGMAGFTPEERTHVMQEITDVDAVNATWSRRGDGPWSLVDPLR
jgi:hypothetical protein